MIDYASTITRIEKILKADQDFDDNIKEFQTGDWGSGGEINAQAFPLCRITTATSPEVSRTMISPAPDANTLPGQQIITEYWIIIAATGAIPYLAQRKVYGLVQAAERILSRNVRLLDPSTDDDPLCVSSEISHQNRYEQHKGKLLEAMVIRLRTVSIVRTEGIHV